MNYKFIKKKIILIKKDKVFLDLFNKSASHFFIQILGMFFANVFIILITRNYGASVYGIFPLTLAFLNISGVICRLGLDTAIVKFIAESLSMRQYNHAKNYYLKTIYIVLVSGFIIYLVMLLLTPILLKSVFKKGYIEVYMNIILLGLIPFILLRINAQTLRGFQKIKEFSFLVHAAPRFIATLTILFVFFLGYDSDLIPFKVFVFSLYITMILSFLFVFRSFKTILSGKKNLLVNKNKFKVFSLLKVSYPMFITNTTFLMMTWLNVILIGIFRPESDVGIYNVAMRVALLASLSLNAVNSIAVPKFAEMFGKKNFNELEKNMNRFTKMTFFSSVPFFLILIVFPKLIMSVFGEEFKSGFTALIIVVFGQLLSALCGPVGELLNMTGHQKRVKNIMVAGIFLNLILGYLLIPRFGVTGAAITFTMVTFFWNIALTYGVWKKFNFIPLKIITQIFTYKKLN